jgi:hypothetical protein
MQRLQGRLPSVGDGFAFGVRDQVAREAIRNFARYGAGLRDQDYPVPAVVMAQTACEVCMEVVLTDVLRERVRDHDIANFITGSLRNYNPKTDNVKKLYELLFGDRVQGASFWPSFLEHVKRRNNIVHRGQAATPQDADESIVAVDKVIRHLLQKRA